MGVVLVEEAIVDDKLSIRSCAIEDVDLQEEKIISINTTIITWFHGMHQVSSSFKGTSKKHSMLTL